MLWIWQDGGARIKALLAVLRPWNAKKKKKSLRNDVKVAGFSTRDDEIALVIETRGVWRYVITCQRSPVIKTGGRLWAFDIAAPMKAAYLAEPEAGGKLRRMRGAGRHTERRWSHRKLREQLRLRSMQKHPLAPSRRSAGAYWDGGCGRFNGWKVFESPCVFIERIRLIRREEGFVEKLHNMKGVWSYCFTASHMLRI